MMHPKLMPLLESQLIALTGLFLITEDPLGIAHYIASQLQKQGAYSVILGVDSLGNHEQLSHQIEELRQQYGSVTGIIHLAPVTPFSQVTTLEQWRTYTACHAKSLYYLVHHCCQSETPTKPPALKYVVSASLLGGYFGRQGNPITGLGTGGAANGFLKTLAAELPEIKVKTVDFEPSFPPEMMAQFVLQEMVLSPSRIEVGYAQGQRIIFETIAASLPQNRPIQCQPEKDWVVLVTGGARGITAEVMMDLASLGLTLVIMGRSPYPVEEATNTKNIENVAQLRRIFLEEARSQGPSKTPVQIERQIQHLLGQRTIRENLDRFQELGAKVEYLTVDVKNAQKFQAAIQGIYERYGRLDGIIHGAGIIEDKLIVDKVPESFERVFDTKVDSSFIITQSVQPDSLKLLVLFSSVAGRYGNRGQSDYAAANEVINRMAWQLDTLWPNTRVVAINWGPWDTTGMASEDIKRQFIDRGVIPIDLKGGCQFFAQELRYGQKGETEVMAGVGPWEAYEQQMANRHQPAQTTVSTPLMFVCPQKLQLQADSTVTLDHSLSLENDPYLRDHCIDGQLVLPAAGALEWLAEFVQVAWPDWIVTGVQDLRLFKGLVLAADSSKIIQLKARASTHADAGSLQVIAEIVDPQKNIPFYRGIIELQPQLPPAPQMWETPLNSGQTLDPSQAYQQYLFHGKCFQLLEGISQVSPQGIDAQIRNSDPLAWFGTKTGVDRSAARWLFDPGVIDLAPQLAIIWTRVQQDMTVLPSKFGTVTRYDCPETSVPSKVAFRVTQTDAYIITYDAIFFDAQNNVHFYLQNIQGTGNAQLNRLGGQSS
jgi:NAD(P)-dependent dehydrogenase (short-subunit alcohol dehydrogenase family)